MFGFGRGLELGEGGDEGAAEVFDAAEGVVGDGLPFEVFHEPEGAQERPVLPEERQLRLHQALLANILFQIKSLSDPSGVPPIGCVVHFSVMPFVGSLRVLL